MKIKDLLKYEPYLDFIREYSGAQNAATGSKVDANANVDHKNIATLANEIPKQDLIAINRLTMHRKLTEMFGEDVADRYLDQLDKHLIYRHDESHLVGTPYCVSITMYPFLFSGLKGIGGTSAAPQHLHSFCGSFVNLVFAIAAQFAGAVSTPEFLAYMDYFIRKDYGDDYYLHPERIVDMSNRQRSIDHIITDCFDQVVYSINQPAAARGNQAVFWNIAYFDYPYFEGMFAEFVFPDGTGMQWESVSWLQKRFMKWFNQTRLKVPLTFPVETMNLLDDGMNFVDTEWAEFTAEMLAEGHSFFIYHSNTVDSLASCCFAPDTMILAKSSEHVFFMPIEDLHDMPYTGNKSNLTVYHNGSWVSAKTISFPARDMFQIVTSNHKKVVATDNHIFPTLRGDVRSDELRTDDYILFNTMELDAVPEHDLHLTYEEGFLVGMYLGDGSIDAHGPCQRSVMFSLNQSKYISCIEIMEKALADADMEGELRLSKAQHNTYPVGYYGDDLADYIEEFVDNGYAHEKRLRPRVFLQSAEFRRGILMGLYSTDGGNSNRIYSTSKNLVSDIECLCATLGINTCIDVSNRTDEPIIIRGEEWKRNYPLYCIRWYDPKNQRSLGDVYKVYNNGMYFRVTSITKVDAEYDEVYCFEVANQNEPYFTLPNGIITHNCRLRNELQDNTFSYTLGAGGVSTGSKCVISMNINRLVQNASRDGVPLSDAVRQQVDDIHKYLLAVNEIIKEAYHNRMLPVYDAEFIALEKQYLTVGINGFIEGAEFLGIAPAPFDKQYEEYCQQILKPIYDANKALKTDEIMINTEFVPAENLGVKFAAWDRRDGYVVPRDCYNSYFYRVEDENCNVLDKLILHGKSFTEYLDGGSACHINLDEHLSKAQYMSLMRTAVRTGCPYFTFNIPNTVCNNCGHISKHRLTECPKCGSHNLDYLTRVIGYLKRVSAFSEARQQEEKRRYYAGGIQ